MCIFTSYLWLLNFYKQLYSCYHENANQCIIVNFNAQYDCEFGKTNRFSFQSKIDIEFSNYKIAEQSKNPDNYIAIKDKHINYGL